MKRFFTLFALCLFAVASWARVVVFEPNVDGIPTAVVTPFYLEKDGVSIECPQVLNNGTQFRFYKNQPVTISSIWGETITQIELVCVAVNEEQYGPAGIGQVNCGTYTYYGNSGIWSGAATQVVLVPSKHQLRVTKIIVILDDTGLSAPRFSPVAGRYFDPLEVSITCSTEGAKIYYTTNGSNPTTDSREFTAPFTLNSDATVKAISALDGEISEVVVAEYEILDATSVDNIAAYSAIEDETIVRFVNPVSAVAQYGKYLYVKDDSGHGLFFGETGQTYQNGDVIPAGFGGRKTTYGGEPELSNPINFQAASSNSPIDPDTVTTAQINPDLWAHYVFLENVTIDPDAKTMSDDYGTVPVYFNMGLSPSQVTAGVPYDVWGIIGSYKPMGGDAIYQVLITSVRSRQEQTLCDLFDMEDDETFTAMSPMTVTYQYGSYLYLKQNNCYGLVYGATGQTYRLGDIIPPGWSGIKKTYDGKPEVANPTGFQPASGNEPLEPVVVLAPDINDNNWAHFVEMRDVTISEVNGLNFKITDKNGNTCIGYARFFDAPLQEGHYSRIRGIVGSHRITGGETINQFLLTDLDSDNPPGDCLRDLYNYPAGTNALITLKVIYQNGTYLYVQDKCEEYGLIYGNLGLELENGDIIEGYASWTLYGETKELIPDVESWHIVCHSDPVVPVEVSIEEISIDMVHWYVLIKDVELQTNPWIITDETGELIVYNRFDVEIPDASTVCSPDLNDDGEVNIADLNVLIDCILGGSEGQTLPGTGDTVQTDDGLYDIIGFITVYRGVIEIYPIRIIKHGSQPLFGDLNGDGEVNIADINVMIDFILSL